MRTPTAIAAVGLAAFGAGLLFGLWLGGMQGAGPAQAPVHDPGVSPSRGGGGANANADADAVATPSRTGEPAIAPGAGTGAGAADAIGIPSSAAGGAAAAAGAAAAGPASDSGSGPPRGASGTIRPGTSTGRPARTDANGTPPSAAAAAPGTPKQGRTGGLPPYALPETITGRLSDAAAGTAIAGATVSLEWETGDGTLGSSVSADLKEDGTFTLPARERMRATLQSGLREGGWMAGRYAGVDEALADMEFSLAGRATGYDTLERGDPGTQVDLPLARASIDRLPGSVRVDARRLDGSLFPARLLVDFMSADRSSFSQWALPEPDGTFLFPGIPSGEWKARVAGKHDSGRKIRVPEVGEVRVALRIPREGLQEDKATPDGDPREVEVSVAGRDAGPGSSLRAEARPGLFFRSEVVAGAALFTALPPGRWTFVLERPGRREEFLTAAVPPGSERWRTALPAPGAEKGDR